MKSMKSCILVVARDADRRAMLARRLMSAGYAVELSEEPGRARELAKASGARVAVLVMSDFGATGADLARQLRESLDEVILIDDRDEGPLGILQRIRLALQPQAEQPPNEPDLVRFDDWHLDVGARSLWRGDNGSEVSLTRSEFDLLLMFLRHAGWVLSRDQLRNAVAGRSVEAYERSIDMLVGRLRRKLERDPKRPRLIITIAGVGYRFDVKPQSLPDATALPGEPSVPRLSIVVLPFVNLGGDSDQEYFVDGVTESLITDLSRISGSFVIARNTSFAYKGKLVDIKEVGRRLGVRYVLEGSVQRSGSRIRVNVQLIESQTRKHLWADRFDKPLADLFDMQDEIVARLANQLGTELIAVEAQRAESSRHPDSTDLYFRGMAWLNKGFAPDNLSQARACFERALALVPGHIEALIGRATVDVSKVVIHLAADDRAVRLAAVEADLTKVLSLRPGNARAHYTMGVVQMFSKRPALGISECERALALDRNLAAAHASIGQAKYFMGRAEETEAHIQEALRISPIDTNVYIWFGMAGFAQLHLGHDEEAVVRLHHALEINPNFPSGQFYLTAALANLGRIEESRSVAQAGFKLDPSFTISRFRANVASDHPTYLAQRERIYEGMRKAGLPEA
jgi:TolB-like protein/DNA-binding response OmpR family regulator/tetratricopeptide (TPR) repeat protein